MTKINDLPSVDRLARDLEGADLPRAVIVAVCREELSAVRQEILQHQDPGILHQRVQHRLDGIRASRTVPVINATGVLLHTNLGRAPWPAPAAELGQRVGVGYSNLELDLRSGKRGGRGNYVEALLCSLTGAEAAMVVNNNAGALFLCLAALAAGQTVVVSRGELIEIGGSYRLPDLMRAADVQLREVGTTNRTHLADYEREADSVELILKVHPSNYRIEGFASAPSLSDLAGLAYQRQIPLLFDVGSGLLDSQVPWLPGPPPAWLADEPGVRQSLEGADLVLFSGDKLLGGPQAGLVVGRQKLVSSLRAHPLARALRVDGSTLAALTLTLEAYADGRGIDIPFWKMVATSSEELRSRGERIVAQAGIEADLIPSLGEVGAGSVPGATLSGPALAPRSKEADRMFHILLSQDPPILGHRVEGQLRLELRTVLEEQDADLARALSKVFR